MLKCVRDFDFFETGTEPIPRNVYDAYQRNITQEQIKLEAEAKEHSDLFLAPMMDTYGGLPRKVKEALRYCLTVNHGSDWCMKVDDDMIGKHSKRRQEQCSCNYR